MGGPEIEFVIADGPTPGSWTGQAAMATEWRAFLDAWEGGIHCEVDECRELDGERVLVLHHWGGRGKTSGLRLGQMQTNGANLFHIRGGRVMRLVMYFDPARALADLGLATEAGSPHS